jgi:hypothetical protein
MIKKKPSSFYFRNNGWIKKKPKVKETDNPFKDRKEALKIMELNMVLYGKW